MKMLNTPNRDFRVVKAMSEEKARPTRFYYLSFSDEEKGWLGACIIEAPGPATAMRASWKIGCNPGGEVLIIDTPPGVAIQECYRNRLLTLAEVKSLGLGAVKSIKGE